MVDVLCPIRLTWLFVRILTADYSAKCSHLAVAFSPTLPNWMILNGHMIYRDPHLYKNKNYEQMRKLSNEIDDTLCYSLYFERYVFVWDETIFTAYSALPPII